MSGGIAWVTGAGSGIGRACAVALAKAGWRVALTGRRAAPLEETASLLPKGAALAVPADLTDEAAVRQALARVEAELGPVGLLVNNAGSNVPRRHWHQLSGGDARALVDVNLTAPFLTSLAVLPGMKGRGGGLIVQIASVAGKGSSAVSGPGYIAAKSGYVALSASLNAENGIHNIRSTCICPGEVATPILDLRPEPPPPEERARMLQPEDIAQAVLFVANLPDRVCINEIVVSPTWNRFQAPAAQAVAAMA
ncbi:SDR family oxidoreductase [Pseudoroseomonas cervicalis]|uniref:SDR family oxidoreductase n=1 Tax=Teichococcus cervicalis TaxID=204525 RepID=UPI00278203A1|nr:SDR family oxidoreductase [Pseudoroseomonas cervicalis]MDQ1081349.1 NADP-dependent 3-hydroxy acid dehydrogenase YdfG [Pseudoroseomonas cervicalis]